MGIDQIFPLILANGGPMAVLVAYIVWRDGCDRKERKDHAAARAEIKERDIASREKLASSLTALSMVIQGRPNV